MCGNAYEQTMEASPNSWNSRLIRGGSIENTGYYGTVSTRWRNTFTGASKLTTFRVMLYINNNSNNKYVPKFTCRDTKWTNRIVDVNITYPKAPNGINQYSFNGKNWRNLPYETEEIDVKENQTIYARIIDSNGNVMGSSTYTVTNIDKQLPVISDMYFGGMLYEDPTFSRGNNSIEVYNNLYNGSVKHERISMTTPCGNNAIKITTNGKADHDLGGFQFCTQTSPSQTFISKIVAKIPKGYKLTFYSNLVGNDYNGDCKWLTSNEGTGDWEEYVYKITTHSSGTFGTTNFYSISGKEATADNPVVWYLAYATVFSDKKYNGNQGMSFKSTDNSGILCYGISESSTQTPTWVKVNSPKSIATVITELVGNKNYCLWVKDIAGNIAKKEFKISSTVEIGDIINYKPDVTSSSSYGVTQENLTWKVSNVYDDGTIKLIGSESNNLITLDGADGYNNGVTKLNTVCRTLYSRGIYKARSIKLEDIEEHMTAAAYKEKTDFTYEGHRYGEACTYYGNPIYYPEAFEYERDAGINGVYSGTKGMSDEINVSGQWKNANNITIKHRDYVVNFTPQNYGKAVNALKENEIYWIATRRNRCDNGHGDFGLFVGRDYVGGHYLCGSQYVNRTLSCRYKPVIELDKNIVLKHNNNGTHDIIQY